ncbi:plasmid partitioning protein RepA [Cereibacter sphaeroides]|uniref:plasmid partitioning protein RepA n=1 Tax=Cereibacter sphaeroides TaxID=1063 RepID=UPI001F16E65D|nr:plasmid partitioning protein RepA [Cereibacter sphaeroides]MCE6958395.1 plasmid partitioning protein RepA [Cereibacter sphaeroides]MCE6972262.1 plasmid partitioning protein RepA [Cereibacter sphaeroides]
MPQTAMQAPARPLEASAYQSLEMDADALMNALEKHMIRVMAPEMHKQLRTFSSAEVAALLGLSQTHLRKMHFDGKIPDVPADDRGRRLYSARDIYAIRVALARTAKDPRQYLPGRVGNEPLMTVACSTFKGGAGKTTTAAHVAQKCALDGYRVLVIDLDPQASLSTLMGLRPELDLTNEGTVYDAIRYEDPRPMEEVIRQTYFHNLDIASGGLILSEFETETAKALQVGGTTPFYLRLHEAIQQVEDRYDIVFIDCPPQLGFLTMSAMVAANALLVPVVANMIDISSLSQFLHMASSLLSVIEESGLEHRYQFVRYVLCRHEPTDAPQVQMAAFLRMQFGERVMAETFLKSTLVSDAGMTQNTLYEIDKSSVTRGTYERAVESFNGVARELQESIHRSWGRV